MTWGGLVKSISKKWNIQEICHDQSSDALAFIRGLNVESNLHIRLCRKNYTKTG